MIKKTFFSLLGLIILLCLLVIAPVDRTHVQETGYYRLAMSRLDSIKSAGLDGPGLYFKVGWAKTNMTPSYSVPLSGYGSREGALSIGVHDSLWVRGFVFDNGNMKTALITLDALLVPPSITFVLRDRLPEIGFSLENVFLSATHTHCSVGAWGDSWIANKFAGHFNPQIVEDVTRAILKTIQKAEANLANAKMGFSKYDASPLVTNRLVGNKGRIDPWFRVIKIQKDSGQIGLITTFSAHPTCLSGKEMRFSRGYPGALVDSLESLPQVDFAAFCAGGVGSHRPESGGFQNYDRIGWLASSLKNKMSIHYLDIPVKSELKMNTIQFNIPLREPHWRISTNWRIRPWIFHLLFEPTPHYISILRFGEIILAGMPCDFSGELIHEIEYVTEPESIDFIATSFNGGYVGYITKDSWYDLHGYETFIMNWFGPNNGTYFVEIIQKLTLLFN